MSPDFQRVAGVRARQRSRRKRQVGVLATLLVAASIAAVFRLVAPLIPASALLASGPGVTPLSHSASLGGNVHHEAQGWVKTVERKTGLIRVSSGFLGLMSLALLVTPETLLIVGDKEGGIGDIHEGGRVKVAYEASSGSLRAKRVEVLVERSHSAAPAPHSDARERGREVE